ncbi:MAG: hypothetical protein JXB50_12995 [Spirochaetes bacterium]|nr:hypothetical protein [Spirochaetota bacterium]
MGSIDDIKKKLKIENLDNNTRQDMYNKFVEKGGKVVEESQKKAIQFNRDRQKYIQKLEEQKKKKYQNFYQSTKNKNDQTSTYKSVKKELSGKKDNIKRYLSIYISAFFQGIFTISGFFTKRFSLEMNENLINILNEFKQVTQPILSLNVDKKWEIMDVLNLNNPYSYEILIRYNKLLKNDDFNLICGYFRNQNLAVCTSILKPLIVFFKEILILYPYWETSKSVLWEAQQYYQDLTSIIPVINKSRINKNIDRIFSYYLPKIFMLINYNLGYRISFDYKEMCEMVTVSGAEDMGSITADLNEQKKLYYEQLQKEKEKKLQELKAEADKKEMEKIPKFIIKGLELIDQIILNALDRYDKDNNLNQFAQNEKMLEFYAIFNEFDKEYSFIMTTSQIKYNAQLVSGNKIDIKYELDNLYIKFNEIITLMKEYVNLNESYKKINENQTLNPMFKDQELNKAEVKKSQVLYEIRTRSGLFFKKFALTLQRVIQDYDNEKKLIQNGDDRLHFELSSDKKAKFEGVKIINSIILSFSFSSAFHYYLTRGKLSSRGLYLAE